MVKGERQLKRARRELAAGSFGQAHASALEALGLDPRNVEALDLLSQLASLGSAPGQAVDLMRRAHAFEPGNPRVLTGLAAALTKVNQLVEARQFALRALAAGPRDAPTLDRLGAALNSLGAYRKALDVFDLALKSNPKSAPRTFNRGLTRQFLGDLPGAETDFRRAIALEPDFAPPYYSLAEVVKQTPADNLVETLEALIADPRVSPTERRSLGYALAKTRDDLGQPLEAIAALDAAKRDRRTQNPYDRQRDKAVFEFAQATFPSRTGEQTPCLTDAPIFVVGLPRTGTTLVDRILSSHPDVASLGELQYFPQLVEERLGRQSKRVADPSTIERAATGELGGLGQAYVDVALAMRGSPGRFIDKLPFNFLYAGIIHRTLPNARIVCLTRDPLDSCLSIYRQRFAEKSYFHDFTYSLRDIAGYVVMFSRLIDHWRSTMPRESFFRLSYEDLIFHQEDQTRALLEFCGLPWDDRCMDFQNNAAGVSTASSVQTRQPLFRSSIGRCDRYAAHLAPARDILRTASLVT